MMPIHGLTTGAPRWPRLGVLRKGDEKPNDRQPGKDLEKDLRFVGADPGVEHDFAEALGGLRVPELVVRLPYAAVDDCWQNWNEEWVAGGLVCRCDGRSHVLWRQPNGEYSTDPVPCPGRPQCSATPVGRLEVLVPDLERMGTVTVLTTSRHDIANIDGCLRALALAFGDLTYVPLRLSRVPRSISTPETEKQNGRMVRTGKRLRRVKWLLHLEAAPEWVRHMIDARGRAPLELTAGEVRSLPAPVGGATGFDPSTDIDVVDPYDGGERIDDAEMAPGDPPEPDHWTPEIAAAVTVQQVSGILARAQNIEPLPKRENVQRLCYRRTVEIVRGSLVLGMPVEMLRRAEQIIASLPDDTTGRNEALDLIIDYQNKLATEVITGTPATADKQKALVPA